MDVQCGKVGYPTERAAKQALNRIRQEYPKRRRRLRKHPITHYPCKHCGQFHLTSSGGKRYP